MRRDLASRGFVSVDEMSNAGEERGRRERSE